jgi:hypothetical protein
MQIHDKIMGKQRVNCENFAHIWQRYELKGSMLGRIATSEGKMSPTVVLKDIDLMISHKKFVLGKERKQELVKQARAFMYSYRYYACIRCRSYPATTANVP